jgi:hypothetical protein
LKLRFSEKVSRFFLLAIVVLNEMVLVFVLEELPAAAASTSTSTSTAGAEYEHEKTRQFHFRIAEKRNFRKRWDNAACQLP